MRKNKQETEAVRTTVTETILIILICIVVFSGLIFVKLAPYIGAHIVKENAPINDVTALDDKTESDPHNNDVRVTDDNEEK